MHLHLALLTQEIRLNAHVHIQCSCIYMLMTQASKTLAPEPGQELKMIETKTCQAKSKT